MFRHRQQLSRWAARVLLMWLFGLGASIANACLPAGQAVPAMPAIAPALDSMTPAHGASAHEESHHGDMAIAAPDDGAPCHHGTLARTNCQDFCAKATVSIPPLKSALDDVQAHAVFATAVTTALPVPAFAPVQSWVPRRDGVLAPPIPIVFLRLAL